MQTFCTHMQPGLAIFLDSYQNFLKSQLGPQLWHAGRRASPRGHLGASDNLNDCFLCRVQDVDQVLTRQTGKNSFLRGILHACKAACVSCRGSWRRIFTTRHLRHAYAVRFVRAIRLQRSSCVAAMQHIAIRVTSAAVSAVI